MSKKEHKSSAVLAWCLGILATVIGGVVTYWLTEGVGSLVSTQSTPGISSSAEDSASQQLEEDVPMSSAPSVSEAESVPVPESNSVPAEDSPVELPNQFQPVAATVIEKGFTFELVGCKNNTNTVPAFMCNLLIESDHNDERILSLHAASSRRWRSRFIDSQGNEVTSSLVKIGEREGDREVKADLSPGIPIKASVYFDASPESGLKLLDLGTYLYGNGGGSFSVEFRFD